MSRSGRRNVVLTMLVCATALAPAAQAHPLGDLSINHVTYVTISTDRVELLYLLDQAEVPTFQERELSDPEVIDRKLAEIRRGLIVTVDGREYVPRLDGRPDLTSPIGDGGLLTTRLEVPLVVRVQGPREVEVRDETFPDSEGLVSMQAAPGEGTDVTLSEEASTDATDGLRSYEGVDRENVLVDRGLTFTVQPGDGTLTGPNGEVIEAEATPSGEATEREGSDPFTDLFEDAAAGEGVFALFLLAAFGWGALHALSPGHGKAMVAAYLVGTRGNARHAFALGAIVTVTHTIGVFALGLVTLVLAEFILPEDLYPWLNLAAGLLIVAVGAGVLRSRLRYARSRRDEAQGPDEHFHDDGHGHGHANADHEAHGHDHTDDEAHALAHASELDATWRGILGMGVSAGLIPCPSALVVLLAAISQHQVGLGLILIVAFSLGLATTLTVLGLVVLYAKRIGARASSPRLQSSRVVAALPLASNVLILAVGLVLTAKALPDVL